MAWKILKQNKNYSINEHGEIKNNATGKIKQPTLNKNGYYYVDLYENNKRKKYPIQLLFRCFLMSMKLWFLDYQLF